MTRRTLAVQTCSSDRSDSGGTSWETNHVLPLPWRLPCPLQLCRCWGYLNMLATQFLIHRQCHFFLSRLLCQRICPSMFWWQAVVLLLTHTHTGWQLHPPPCGWLCGQGLVLGISFLEIQISCTSGNGTVSITTMSPLYVMLDLYFRSLLAGTYKTNRHSFSLPK